MNAAYMDAANVGHNLVAAAHLDDLARRIHALTLRDSQVLRQRRNPAFATLATDFFCEDRNNERMADEVKDSPTLLRRLKELRAKGATQRGLAKHLGIDASGVNRLVHGNRQLKADEIDPINEYLQRFSNEGVRHGTEPMNVHIPPPFQPSEGIPVLGTTGGAYAGSFAVTDTVVNRVDRPSKLADARDLYAIYIFGSAMEPEHRAGDARLINPHRPPRLGDSVLVKGRLRESGPVQAFLGYLVAETDKELTIEQLKPSRHTVKFDPRLVTAVHKVMTYAESYGL